MARARILTQKEKAEVADYLQHGHVPLLLQVLYDLFYETGLRVAEVTCLTFGMFYDEKGRIARDFFVPKELCKGNCQCDRLMALSRETRDLLQRYFNWANERQLFRADFFLFPSREGPTKPCSPSTTSRRLKKIFLAALGTCDRLSSHTPRRTLATDLFNPKSDIKIVQYSLGHRHAMTSFSYIETSLGRVNHAKHQRLARQRAFQKGFRPKRLWDQPLPARREVQAALDLGEMPDAQGAVPLLSPTELELARTRAENAALKRRQELKQLGAVKRFNSALPKRRRPKPKGATDWPPGKSE